MKLNPDNIPAELRSAFSFAERWGIGDDFEREESLANASKEELEAVAHSIDNLDDAVLVSWLTGPESKREPLSPEYLAFTNLTMAVHSAKIKLKRMT